MNQSTGRYLVLTPVLDDWESLNLLLQELDCHLSNAGLSADVLAIDDGSHSLPTLHDPLTRFHSIGSVKALRLRRNLGHQRAIAIGLAYAEQNLKYEAVIVMDADGEDRPDHVIRLCRAHGGEAPDRIIFALRSKRTEGIKFRLAYGLFRTFFLLLTGKRIRFGNFSLIPFRLLPRVVGLSELWNHYSSGILKGRIPFTAIPCHRGHRLAGTSRMNFVSLTTHGLSAISVYADVVGTRLLLATTALVLAGILASLGVCALRIGTDYAIPGWATCALGLALIGVLQLVTLAFLLAIAILNSRTASDFLPVRDYAYFVIDVSTLYQTPSIGQAQPGDRQAFPNAA